MDDKQYRAEKSSILEGACSASRFRGHLSYFTAYRETGRKVIFKYIHRQEDDVRSFLEQPTERKIRQLERNHRSETDSSTRLPADSGR